MTGSRRTRHRLAALAVAAVLVAAACSDQEAPSPEVSPAPSPPTTSVAPLDPTGLEPLVVDDAPSGFTLAGDDVGGTGATDLAEAAGDTSDAEAGAALADAGFVRGWQRLWVSDDEATELFLLVYEFSTVAGAEAFFDRTAGDVAEGDGAGVFEVPGIPGAVGVGGGADGLTVNAVVFTTGPYLVQVIGDGPEPGPSPGTVVALAAAQAQRLA